MPTRPAFAFLVLSGIFYFLANQTGVGWLYIISNGLIGMVAVAMVYGIGLLRGIKAERQVARGDTQEAQCTEDLVFEDDAVKVEITMRQEGNRPVTSLRGTEICPFAPPDAHTQSLFIPTLLPNRPVTLAYPTTADRRGAHKFPPLAIETQGPFGLWRSRQRVESPTTVLVYPTYHLFTRLPLLENALNPQRQRPRAGTGSEVMGVRDYRPGDAPRTVHWRSSARVGQLMVKEFAEEAQPALTVVMDCATPSALAEGKQSPFESAVRIAASLGYYATRRTIPFHLVAVTPTLTPPRAALSWWATLNVLARLQNDGNEPFEQVVARTATASVVAALVTNPTESVLGALHSLARRGGRVLAILVVPDNATLERTSPLPTLTFVTVRATHWREDLALTPSAPFRNSAHVGVATTP